MEELHVPGGLICVGLAMDPTLTLADRLVGQLRRSCQVDLQERLSA
jgi:translation initiation factor 2 gamma subunit (eIF-2gamma)